MATDWDTPLCLTILSQTESKRWLFETKGRRDMAGRMVGGLSAPEPATPEVQEIANQVKGQLEEKVNARYPTFEAVLFCTQVVAGTNYFIKVRHGNGERDCVHLRVFRALPCYGGGTELSNYQLGKTKDDPITYF